MLRHRDASLLPAKKAGPRCGSVPDHASPRSNSPCQKGGPRCGELGLRRCPHSNLPAKKAGPRTATWRLSGTARSLSLPKRQGPIAASPACGRPVHFSCQKGRDPFAQLQRSLVRGVRQPSPCQKGRAPLRHRQVGTCPRSACFSLPKRQGPVAATRSLSRAEVPARPPQRAGPHCGRFQRQQPAQDLSPADRCGDPSGPTSSGPPAKKGRAPLQAPSSAGRPVASPLLTKSARRWRRIRQSTGQFVRR